eukprot:12350885-Alexandrium_andersonii.AAC.1
MPAAPLWPTRPLWLPQSRGAPKRVPYKRRAHSDSATWGTASRASRRPELLRNKKKLPWQHGARLGAAL